MQPQSAEQRHNLDNWVVLQRRMLKLSLRDATDEEAVVLKRRFAGPYEIGWAAGIIDGEGSIMISPTRHGGERNGYQVIVRASNTQPAMADTLQRIWGGSISKCRQSSNLGYKPIYAWAISSNKALALLEQIEPHLVIKRAHAIIAIEMQKRIAAKTGYEIIFNRNKKRGFFNGAVISKSEMLIRHEMYLKLRDLNKRPIDRCGIPVPRLCPGKAI